ncbi:hypothetical protein Tco_1035707 [Tanacetum coccineum]
MMSEDSSAAGTDNRPLMLEAAFIANLSSSSSQINEVRTFNDTIFETVSHSLSPKVPHDEHLDSDDDEVLEDYTIPKRKTLEDKYLEEIVCLKSANQVATGLLQKFQMPTQTIPMLSKKPMIASSDIHKIGLGFIKPVGIVERHQLSQPSLLMAIDYLQPGHLLVLRMHVVTSLARTEVSKHENVSKTGQLNHWDYAKLNALYDQFVPQKELSREQAYWLSATDIASLTSDPPKPVDSFCSYLVPNKESRTRSCLTKPATESRKPMPKSHTQNHRILPSKSVNARRAADHNRKLNVVDHNQFVIRSLKFVKYQNPPRQKNSVESLLTGLESQPEIIM